MSVFSRAAPRLSQHSDNWVSRCIVRKESWHGCLSVCLSCVCLATNETNHIDFFFFFFDSGKRANLTYRLSLSLSVCLRHLGNPRCILRLYRVLQRLDGALLLFVMILKTRFLRTSFSLSILSFFTLSMALLLPSGHHRSLLCLVLFFPSIPLLLSTHSPLLSLSHAKNIPPLFISPRSLQIQLLGSFSSHPSNGFSLPPSPSQRILPLLYLRLFVVTHSFPLQILLHRI